MLILIALLIVICVGALTVAALHATPGQVVVGRRLDELQSGGESRAALKRRRRREQSERLSSLLLVLGERLDSRRKDGVATRAFLVQAGYVNPTAPAIFWGTRLALAFGLPVAALMLLPPFGIPVSRVVLGGIWAGGIGWIAPSFWLRKRIGRRQKNMQRAIPDMLDMLVVCVEAGLGLNQAIQRVADEIDHVSQVLSEQLAFVNLEIRAGTPREEALRHLADRTGLADLRTLTAMLIQTDRFGTSVAQALRVQSDTLRTQRRQRAEEAAAKTTIKLVFPLVLFVFPAMFVVILGPVVLAVLATFGTIRP